MSNIIKVDTTTLHSKVINEINAKMYCVTKQQRVLLILMFFLIKSYVSLSHFISTSKSLTQKLLLELPQNLNPN